LLVLAACIPRSAEYRDVLSVAWGLLATGIPLPAALQRRGLSWSCLDSHQVAKVGGLRGCPPSSARCSDPLHGGEALLGAAGWVGSAQLPEPDACPDGRASRAVARGRAKSDHGRGSPRRCPDHAQL